MPITPADRVFGGRPRQKYTKRKLLFAIAEQTGIPKYKVAILLEAMGNLIKSNLVSGQAIYLPNVGLFYKKTVKATTKINPVTGLPMAVSSKKRAGFRAGITLKTTL